MALYTYFFCCIYYSVLCFLYLVNCESLKEENIPIYVLIFRSQYSTWHMVITELLDEWLKDEWGPVIIAIFKETHNPNPPSHILFQRVNKTCWPTCNLWAGPCLEKRVVRDGAGVSKSLLSGIHIHVASEVRIIPRSEIYRWKKRKKVVLWDDRYVN